MSDRGDVVFHLPGEGMARGVLAVARVLTCLSCKPRFSSRTEAFHWEGGEVLEKQLFVVYKLQGKAHTASLSWLQPCASSHPHLCSPPAHAAQAGQKCSSGLGGEHTAGLGALPTAQHPPGHVGGAEGILQPDTLGLLLQGG